MVAGFEKQAKFRRAGNRQGFLGVQLEVGVKQRGRRDCEFQTNDIQIAAIVSVVLWRKSFAIRQGFFCGLREFVANKAAMNYTN